jgi:hypothetical protein
MEQEIEKTEIIKSIIDKGQGIFTDIELDFLKKLTINSYTKPFMILDKAMDDAFVVSQKAFTFNDEESKIRLAFLKELRGLADDREYARLKITEEDLQAVREAEKQKEKPKKGGQVAI